MAFTARLPPPAQGQYSVRIYYSFVFNDRNHQVVGDSSGVVMKAEHPPRGERRVPGGTTTTTLTRLTDQGQREKRDSEEDQSLETRQSLIEEEFHLTWKAYQPILVWYPIHGP